MINIDQIDANSSRMILFLRPSLQTHLLTYRYSQPRHGTAILGLYAAYDPILLLSSRDFVSSIQVPTSCITLAFCFYSTLSCVFSYLLPPRCPSHVPRPGFASRIRWLRTADMLRCGLFDSVSIRLFSFYTRSMLENDQTVS